MPLMPWQLHCLDGLTAVDDQGINGMPNTLWANSPMSAALELLPTWLIVSSLGK